MLISQKVKRMERKFDELEKKQENASSEKKITRKQALKKTGLMAVSAATMMVMISNNAEARRRRGEPRPDPGVSGAYCAR
ncbi:hypothetical protein SAMN05444274_104355 [Mariniphaga anaerophila]|uniref:Uncharacterized protein n=2 Tax=Mariniphaga anaerophila TaxID=1484053 RepID=A0A1M5AJK7_9BACT|nr:hypothetical protein SAMN05444274_104355 [Mariniphaga anaerophila]